MNWGILGLLFCIGVFMIGSVCLWSYDPVAVWTAFVCLMLSFSIYFHVKRPIE